MTREMKYSGVEWIGNIPREWKIRKIKNVCTLYTGNSIKDNEKNNFTDSTNAIPYIATKEIDVSSSKINYDNGMYVKKDDENFKVAPKHSTLMCIEGGSAGKKIAYLNQEVCFVNKLCCFSAKTMHDKFLHFYLKSPSFNSEFNLHISGLIGGVSQGELKEFSIAIPPLHEQKKIADFLDSKVSEIDKIITETKSSIENYKEYKQSVITEAVTKGLDKNVPMKHSGIEWIGDIPAHWDYQKSFYVYEKIGDIDHYMPKSLAEGYPYVMTGDLRYMVSEIDFDKCKHISEDDYKQLSRKIVPTKGDVLFARYATIGTVCYVDINKKFLVSYSCVTIKPKKTIVDGKYLWYYYQSTAFLEEVKKFINANTQANVGMESLYRAKLLIPSMNEQQGIVNYLDKKCTEIHNIILEKEKFIANLEEYKKSLIYEYVTGKKAVE